MIRELGKKVLQQKYHVTAYRMYAYVSSLTSGLYIAHRIESIAKIQREATVRAHTHRVKAQRLAQ